jgi:hypothetical protein
MSRRRHPSQKSVFDASASTPTALKTTSAPVDVGATITKTTIDLLAKQFQDGKATLTAVITEIRSVYKTWREMEWSRSFQELAQQVGNTSHTEIVARLKYIYDQTMALQPQIETYAEQVISQLMNSRST